MDELITPIPVYLPQGALAVKEQLLLHPIAPERRKGDSALDFAGLLF
jgi:hypothetical protein